MNNAQDILCLRARALHHAIAGRQISCREVMQAYLAQIGRLNPAVNAIVSLQAPEHLLAQADVCDAKVARGDAIGRLHGFPQAPKDLAATQDIVTTKGSPIFANDIPAQDAIIVERARRAGAILIGKTNTPEFGLGSNTYNTVFGTTRNAWNTVYTAGGSSGGAAVALALRMLPVADGSDMMGSLRNPAAWSHVYGLRPSMGRVPYGPTPESFFSQLSTEGPMGRTPEDLAWLLSVQAGYDLRTPLSLAGDGHEFTQPLDADMRGKRIAWLGDYNGYLAMDADAMPLYETALQHFRTLGCTVDAAQPQFHMPDLWTTWLRLRSFTVAGNLRALYAQPQLRAQLKPEACWEVENGQHLTGAQLFEAAQWRTQWYNALLTLFEHFDYLVLPATQVFPFPIDQPQHWPRTIGARSMDTYHRWMEVTAGPTLAGLPTLAVPAGFSPAGLPMGLQIMGSPRSDFELLQLGHAWHQAIPFAGACSPLVTG